MKKTARDIAEALGNGKEVRVSDTEWNTLCPSHNDGNPSLSVADTRDGKVLVRCHAKCSQQDVIEALRQRDLWPKTSTRNWLPIAKAPPTLGAPKNFNHPKFGPASKTWIYKGRKGVIHGYVCRFDKPNGGKELVPMAPCLDNETGEVQWRWKSFAKPRPLYNADLLQEAEHRDKKVLIVEGEKTADAAKAIFDDALVITWPGGGKAVKYTDWGLLKNRDITIWPDADEPGLKTAAALGEILVAEGASSIKVVDLPNGLPQGWDLADDIPEGVVFEPKVLVAQAQAFTPSGDLVIDEMNRKYALVMIGGKTAIIQHKHDFVKNMKVAEYVTEAGVRSMLGNQFVTVGKAEVPVYKYWHTHPMRKTYQGVVFEPGLETPEYFNLWRGFHYEPDPTGDWSILKDHMLRNLAQGDEHLFNWIFGWFAQMFQFPRKKPGTSIAFRGKQGVGKSVLGEHIGELIRDNYVYADDPRYLLGNFNAHMAQALMMQIDEGFFAGDPRNSGRIKGLVTSKVNRIEPKGKDSFEINNYLRLMITSNHDWIVPAAFEERRFAVFDVGEENQQDRSYFGAMARQLENGGYEGLLYDLLHFDLSQVDIGKIPNTSGLVAQKALSIDSPLEFWYEKLRQGDNCRWTGEWEDEIACENLYNEYIAWAKNRGYARRDGEVHFWRKINAVTPKHKGRKWGKKVRRIFAVYSDRGEPRHIKKWGYVVAPLEKCRQSFAEAFDCDNFEMIGKVLSTNEDDAEEDLDVADENAEIPF